MLKRKTITNSVVTSFAMVALWPAISGAQQQAPASVVQVANVSQTELAPTVAVPGTIFSRNDVQVTAGVSGQLLMVAEPGTYLNEGDSVARLDSRPLELQRAEQEALVFIAIILTQEIQLQLVFDPLCYHFQTAAMCQLNNRTRDGRRIGVAPSNIVYEGTVHFEVGDRKLFEISQAGMPHTEVID